MRTIPAPLRPRPGGRAPSAAAELAVAALTVVSGLQLLRLMVSTMVGVYRDRLRAPLASLALFALVVVGLGFLAAPVARLLGRRRALVVSKAGVALVRLVLQLVPDAVARWLLAPVGVVLFLWFVPLWLARNGRGVGLALVAGLAVDTALAGLGGGWDYAWSINASTVALAVVLAGAVPACPGLAEPGPADRARRALPGGDVPGRHGGQPRRPGRRDGRRRGREARWPVVATAVVGLAVAVALGEDATLAAGVLGQAATAVLVVVVVRRSGGVAGLGPTAAAWTAGMGLFVLLVFAYYAAYDVVLPVSNGLLLPLAAVLVGLAAAGAVRFGHHWGPPGRDLVPVWAGWHCWLPRSCSGRPRPARSRPNPGRPGLCG